MALTPFDMEGVNRDLLAAGNPAKPDMQSILRRNARDLVLGNAILVSSVDAKELEFGVHMAYSDADGGFDTDPSEDVWFEASSLPIPNGRPDLPPDNALRIRVTDVLTEYGFTDIDVKAPDRTPEGIWIGFEAMQPVRLDVTSAQEGRSVSFTLTAAEANDWRSGRLDAHGLSRMAVERVLARPGDTVTLAYGDSLFRPAVMCDGSGRLPERWTSPSAGPTHRKRLLRPQGSASRWMTAWKRHTDDKAKEHMMDMNWTDEIRDPEPLKRPIYNAADYDTRHGDPYYREHSTRADSLWRLYEESGTSITFDAFADESRQTDYRMETGALRDFFNGSQSVLSSYRNPMGGNPLIAFGVIGRWDGERTGISSFETFDDLMNGDDSPFKDCEIDHIWDENGILKMRGHHHDGSVEVEIRQDCPCDAPALVDLWKHRLRSRYAESSAD